MKKILFADARQGVDIFCLQRLIEHQDINLLQPCLAQRTEDIAIAHTKGSPMEVIPRVRANKSVKA